METFFDTRSFLKSFEAENKLTFILNVPLYCSDETDKTFFFGLKWEQIFNLIQNIFFWNWASDSKNWRKIMYINNVWRRSDLSECYFKD